MHGINNIGTIKDISTSENGPSSTFNNIAAVIKGILIVTPKMNNTDIIDCCLENTSMNEWMKG